MEIAWHIDALRDEGHQLADLIAEAVAGATLAAAVPGCPEWSVRELVHHVGYVHRWAAAVVSKRIDGRGDDAEADAAVGPTPADDGLTDWYVGGLGLLDDALRSAPADLECFTFLPAPSPLAFWARRQALETAIHRADAAAALGRPVSFDDDLAHDGIDETLLGFGARRRSFEPGSIRVLPGAGPAWRVELGEAGAKAIRGASEADCDATVSGSPTQVYLWLWNRPATVDITGDATVADRWKQVRVRWS